MNLKADRQINTVGIIVPFYNEGKVIHIFHQNLINSINSLGYQFFIYYINDGSTDNTAGLLENISKEDERVTVINFSRNFGHQAALSAGLDIAQGDVVISLDGDGQHPTDLIPEIINLYLCNTDYDIVQTQRESGNETIIKRTTSKMFYSFMNRFSNIQMIEGTADFRLMSRSALETFKKMPEYHKFLRGMIPWMGYKTIILPYKPLERIGGESKYSLKKMVKLAADAIFSFSLIPMRITILLGVGYSVMALAEIIYVISFYLSNREYLLTPGWPSLMFALLIGNAITLISLGIIGYYIGYIFQQVKNRPIYIIQSILSKNGQQENENDVSK